ncbi:DNA/RNA non-specific endonuclease [Hymenobacter sp. BT491]|uniref:DNA/RNA non-specific endonuclease n=1 Tax=Hymenobacter sp. BT491 TaxID=2766779 RepID=UPI0016535D8B|nr:DNA/RNA non-specific endonuclease [Hymenobacter sp. BT491]MBC6991111.1 DNA/RNA non-specific endonuclease [Hymenobacter sp. BT491]
MTPTFRRYLSWCLLSLLAFSCSHDELVAPGSGTATGGNGAATRDPNLAFGNPSGATADASNYTNYLLVKAQYTMSYHRDRGTPNWVSWHLSRAWLGSASRQDDFLADNSLPANWYHVTAGSYVGSGFDRGHQCPSADRTGSVADNSATFLMSNMVPQAPRNNQQTWAGLENYCRTLVDAGNELYLICGSYGKGGTGSAGPLSTLDNGHVTVPNRLWKVIVVLPNGTDDVRRVTSDTRIIAVNTPNDNGLLSTWKSYRTTVDAIERATGYDLLSALPTAVQAVVEARVDDGPTS